MRIKYFLFFAGIVGCGACEMTPAATGGIPVMVLSDTLIDYQSLAYRSESLRTISFSNTGTGPLLVQSIEGDCSCVTAEWPKKPILPGKTGEISIRYDTDRTGGFEKRMIIKTNEPQPEHQIFVKGRVETKW